MHGVSLDPGNRTSELRFAEVTSVNGWEGPDDDYIDIDDDDYIDDDYIDDDYIDTGIGA